MSMQPYQQNAQATPEQQAYALSLNTAPVTPLPVPDQLMTLVDPPTAFPVSVDQELTQQLKRYADPNMFQRLLNNLGPDNTGVNFIRRLSVVAGGAPMFQEPRTSSGQQGAMHQEIIAVMPLIQQTRRRFTAQFGTQGADRIPDCTAVNVTPNRVNNVGFGNPGGLCAVCPHDAFVEGIGRGCRERHAVFALAKGNPFPYYLDLSVYSNRPIMEMLTNLSIASNVDYWQVVMRITLGSTPTRAGQPVSIFKAEPIGVIDSSDPEVCAGIENLRKICHMVLADFAKLVSASKTIRLHEITDPNVIDSTLVNSSQNMPLPPSMADQAPTQQEDMARLGMPAPPQPGANAQVQVQQPQQIFHQQNPAAPVPWAPDAQPPQQMPPQMVQQQPAAPQPPQMPAPMTTTAPQPYFDFQQAAPDTQYDPDTDEFIHMINDLPVDNTQPIPGVTEQNGEF